MRIAILDDYQGAVRQLPCYHKLDQHQVTIFRDTLTDVEALASRVASFEAIVLIRERTKITASLLKHLPKLRLISQTGKAGPHLDLPACTARGIAVAEGIGSPHAPAELTWGLILASRRFIPQEVARLKSGEWQTTIGYVLRGSTLGIWGYGRIGRIVASYGRAFGMRVLVWGRDASLSMARADGLEVCPSKDSLFQLSDVLSLHLRLTDATRAIVTASELSQMKTDALFVNTSRAELVAADALENAIKGGAPGYAAVDVYNSEPIHGGQNPLLHLNNVIATPHLGYVEQQSYEIYFNAAFDNLLAFAAGSPIGIVNPEVLRFHS